MADTRPDWDFAIGYVAPARKTRPNSGSKCQDCMIRPARSHHPTCAQCGRARDSIAKSLLGTIGAPFVP